MVLPPKMYFYLVNIFLFKDNAVEFNADDKMILISRIKKRN